MRSWQVVPGRVDGVRKASLSDNFVTGCEAQPANLHVSQFNNTLYRVEKSTENVLNHIASSKQAGFSDKFPI